jgi:hypothetical protein
MKKFSHMKFSYVETLFKGSCLGASHPLTALRETPLIKGTPPRHSKYVHFHWFRNTKNL